MTGTHNASSTQQFIFNTSLASSLINDSAINPTINDFSSSINDLTDRFSHRKKSIVSSQILPSLEKPLTLSNVAAQSIQQHTSSPMTNSTTTVNTESSASPTPSRSSNSSSNSSPSTTSPAQKAELSSMRHQSITKDNSSFIENLTETPQPAERRNTSVNKTEIDANN